MLATVVESSRVFYGNDSSILQDTRRCTHAPYGSHASNSHNHEGPVVETFIFSACIINGDNYHKNDSLEEKKINGRTNPNISTRRSVGNGQSRMGLGGNF